MAKRAVFEDVSGSRVDRTAPARAKPRDWRRAISLWLWGLAALVALMVLVGGMTRLTESGLSITAWEPVMGAIPPLSQEDWEEAFAAYQTTTQFQEQNHWMTLDDFRSIFWWEWGHRFLGRLIGLVWFVGLVVFVVMKAVPKGWTGRLVIPGVLGALQGGIGWWMVTSGLVGRLEVSPYRLAVHLGLAFVIFAILVWLALRIRLNDVEALKARRRRGSGMGWAGALAGLVFLQILVGALVAGIDAGRGYVDWPLMEGSFLPPESFDIVPFWRNFFENPALVQFIHRMLGYLVLAFGIFAAWRLVRTGNPVIRRRGWIVAGAILLQVVLGIVTIMNAAEPAIAIWHQGGALVVVGLIIWTKFAIAYPPEQRIARA